jgi:ATP-dependent RNA helicase DeaD
LPDTREYYTHRSGRTARAGKKGISLALANSREVGKLREYEQKLKIQFEKVKVPSVQEVQKNHMRSWYKTIRDTETSQHLTEELLDEAYEAWHGIDIETLIEKLVSHEVNKLNYSEDHRDLNDSSRDRGRDRDRGKRSGDRNASRGRDDRRRDSRERGGKKEAREERRKPRQKEGEVTFFINIGRKDNFDETSLRKMISDQTGVKKRDISSVRLRNLNAYFDVDKKHSSKVSSSFNGFEVNGRSIRVNRDNG